MLRYNVEATVTTRNPDISLSSRIKLLHIVDGCTATFQVTARSPQTAVFTVVNNVADLDLEQLFLVSPETGPKKYDPIAYHFDAETNSVIEQE